MSVAYFDEFIGTIITTDQKKILDDISLDGERWYAISGFPKHLISSCGRVYSLHRKKLLSQFRVSKSRKYLAVNIGSPHQSYRNYRVHRLVGDIFLSEEKKYWLDNGWSEGDLEVHHKNHDTYNNNVENLEWIPKKLHRKKHRKSA